MKEVASLLLYALNLLHVVYHSWLFNFDNGMQYIQKAKMVTISHCVELEIFNVYMNILSTLDMNSSKMGPIYSLIQTFRYNNHQGRTML